MKRTLTILVSILLLLLSVGCEAREEVQYPPEEIVENAEANLTEEPVVEANYESVEVCEEMPVFSSVEEMTEAVRTARREKGSSALAQSGGVAELAVFYTPENEMEGFKLLNIEVTPDRIFYRYIPDEEDSVFSYDTGIMVKVFRGREYTMSSICNQLGAMPDEDGFAYVPDRAEMYFTQDQTVISVRVPEHMNNYDTLLSLCEMEKIEIPWSEGEGETGENEPAMPQFSSVDELVSAVQAERASTLKSALAQSGELESLSYLYAPSNIIAGYFLYHIEVTPDYVILNMPHEEAVEPYVEWECVIFTQYRKEEVTLHSICDRYGLTPNEDGWAYDNESRQVFYELDGTVISIQVPEYMNDYDTIYGLCEMEKIEIP